METCGTGIGREKSMNKKVFKEPKIPEELTEVKEQSLSGPPGKKKGKSSEDSLQGLFCPELTEIIFLFSR